ncbi:adenosylhomocysteinase [Acidaminobacter sp. JC074]|uniref:adenosylhomocysteinase n=1 Tax=Acidaminobacter sp. JC074 TaxID=2530199 RepID=UPI001F10F93E|nr:adenosylhomocysteinase [Acidaminobacter sp. JC074]MCH4886520.1 adenosylhomocysteinase [Acidaminobacter sp. JC074]
MKSIIDNQSLEKTGIERLQWFRDMMPLVDSINDYLDNEQIFKGKIIAICMHIEPKTAVWIEGILRGGAKHIYLVGCLGTTKEDTAAYLASLDRMTVLGKKNDTYEDHQNYLTQVMDHKIDLFLDNGASLILAHDRLKPDWTPIGANEETRSGKLLIEKEKVSPDYPVVVIDDSPVKQLLENAIGVGQSVVDGFMRATSLLLGGKQVLVIGYGFCGSGVAKKFKGQGANVMVYDLNPTIRLKAKADGYYVDDLPEVIKKADVIITVTGSFDVIRPDHIKYFKPNVILANSGHYSFEIDVKGLKEKASVTRVKKDIEKLTFTDKSCYLIADASPVNLACGDGNPIEIMDLGLGLQSASAIRILETDNQLKKGLQAVPVDIDKKISIDMMAILK